MRKFSPEERGIFSYFDPDKAPADSPDGMVFADPFIIHAQYESARINQKIDIDAAFDMLGKVAEGYNPESGEPDPLWEIKEKTLISMIPFFHEVFKTKPLAPDGTGITFDEAYHNVISFMNFGDEVKKNTDETPSLPTSSPEPTENLPNGKNTSDSISTKIVSSSSVPTR